MATHNLPWDQAGSLKPAIHEKLLEAKDRLEQYQPQHNQPKWREFFASYHGFLKTFGFIVLYIVTRYLIRTYAPEVPANAPPMHALSFLVTGSLFFISFMVNGVFQDYKIAEKMPTEAVDAIEEFVHAAMICLRQSVHQDKCTEETAAEIHALVVSAAVEMLCMFRESLSAAEKKSFMEAMHATMVDIDQLNQLILHTIGPNPVAVTLVQLPKKVRTLIREVRREIDTDFWPLGHLFVHLIICIIALVTLTVKYTGNIEEFLMIPGVLFIFVFIEFMLADLEDPYQIVDQTEMERLKDHFLMDIRVMLGMPAFDKVSISSSVGSLNG